MPSERSTFERQTGDIEDLKRGMDELKSGFAESYNNLNNSIQDLKADYADTKARIEGIENDLSDKDEHIATLKSDISETKTDIKLIAKDIGWLKDNYKETKEVMEKGKDVIAACTVCKDPRVLQEIKDKAMNAQITAAASLTLVLLLIGKLLLYP